MPNTRPPPAAPPEGPARHHLYPSIGYMIGLLSNRMTSQLDQDLAPLGITGVQWGVCRMLHLGLGRTAAELCRCYHYDSGAMTRTLTTLEKKGLIRRERSREDRRQIHLRLTDDGEALIQQTLPILREYANFVRECFTPEESDRFKEYLERLCDHSARKHWEAQATLRTGEAPGESGEEGMAPPLPSPGNIWGI